MEDKHANLPDCTPVQCLDNNVECKKSLLPMKNLPGGVVGVAVNGVPLVHNHVQHHDDFVSYMRPFTNYYYKFVIATSDVTVFDGVVMFVVKT